MGGVRELSRLTAHSSEHARVPPTPQSRGIQETPVPRFAPMLRGQLGTVVFLPLPTQAQASFPAPDGLRSRGAGRRGRRARLPGKRGGVSGVRAQLAGSGSGDGGGRPGQDIGSAPTAPIDGPGWRGGEAGRQGAAGCRGQGQRAGAGETWLRGPVRAESRRLRRPRARLPTAPRSPGEGGWGTPRAPGPLLLCPASTVPRCYIRRPH